MKTWQIVIVVVAGLLLIPWIVEWIYIRILRHNEVKSEQYICQKLRWIIYINGAVRSGKTTLMAAIINVKSKWLARKAKDRVEFTCLACPKVPFDAIEGILKADYDAGCIDSAAEAAKLCSPGMPMHDYVRSSYSNQVSKSISFITMMKGYVDARWALYRDNYVYYYAKAFTSQINGKAAMDYDPSMLCIKDKERESEEEKVDPKTGEVKQERKSDYHIMEYTIIGEDEKQLSGKDNSQWASYAKADTGSADFLRLIGQIGEETILYVTTNQVWGSDVNRERNLATDILYVTNSWAINPYYMQMFFLKLFEFPFRLSIWIRGRHGKDRRMSPLQETSRSRSVLSVIMRHKKHWSSRGFIVFAPLTYHNANDVGKSPKNAISGVDTNRLTLPLKYCRGSIDTFQFHAIQERLMAHTKWTMRDEPTEVTADALAERALAKRHGSGKASSKANPSPAD